MSIELLGVKPSIVLAGLFGGVVSLAFFKGLTRTQSVLTVVAGAIAAHYVTPFVEANIVMFKDSGDTAAFLIGLFGMNILAGCFTMTSKFKKDPEKYIDKYKPGS